MQESGADRESRLNRVFGDVLPEGTSDDQLDAVQADLDERDRWLQDNRPPHHDTAW